VVDHRALPKEADRRHMRKGVHCRDTTYLAAAVLIVFGAIVVVMWDGNIVYTSSKYLS
jgi:hypothetical protein